ncbi:predicted protein [Plenodomus lingam JN3]|uniref:Uncharacterized protein n=1 Tax=Leptosphaeria maculans (strain JN3 / isolate v23.1.3 / race Av1-4-5-6-7-8) TaxID=985895 RepID=E5A6X2_LEPMJ|nr:predicted protein [Plenodomus lingam JN3]CBX99367.1 predicted protein [Plenodomus lingam JN3]
MIHVTHVPMCHVTCTTYKIEPFMANKHRVGQAARSPEARPLPCHPRGPAPSSSAMLLPGLPRHCPGLPAGPRPP